MDHSEKVIKLPAVESNKDKLCEMYSKVIQGAGKRCHYQKLPTRAAFLRTIDKNTGKTTIKPVVVYQLFETSIMIDTLNSTTHTSEREQVMVDRVPYFTFKSKSGNYLQTDFDWMESSFLENKN